jgi:hypothetical protein
MRLRSTLEPMISSLQVFVPGAHPYQAQLGELDPVEITEAITAPRRPMPGADTWLLTRGTRTLPRLYCSSLRLLAGWRPSQIRRSHEVNSYDLVRALDA